MLQVPATKTDAAGLFLPLFHTSPLGVGIWHVVVRVGDLIARDQVFFTSSLDNFLQYPGPDIGGITSKQGLNTVARILNSLAPGATLGPQHFAPTDVYDIMIVQQPGILCADDDARLQQAAGSESLACATVSCDEAP